MIIGDLSDVWRDSVMHACHWICDKLEETDDYSVNGWYKPDLYISVLVSTYVGYMGLTIQVC